MVHKGLDAPYKLAAFHQRRPVRREHITAFTDIKPPIHATDSLGYMVTTGFHFVSNQRSRSSIIGDRLLCITQMDVTPTIPHPTILCSDIESGSATEEDLAIGVVKASALRRTDNEIKKIAYHLRAQFLLGI